MLWEIENKYTVKANSDAPEAQFIQEILGLPSSLKRDLSPICPLTKSDIVQANIVPANIVQTENILEPDDPQDSIECYT